MLTALHIRPPPTPRSSSGDGTRVLRNPSNAELARFVGLPPPPDPDTICDLLIVGAGPAGLAAAVYGASEGLKHRRRRRRRQPAAKPRPHR